MVDHESEEGVCVEVWMRERSLPPDDETNTVEGCPRSSASAS
jgi:hypothetical protein